MKNDAPKREIRIDAGTGGKTGMLQAVEDAIFGGGAGTAGRVPVSNYDGLYDVLTEFGSGIRLVVDNAQDLDETAKAVLRDAAGSTPGLEIVLNEATPGPDA